MNDKQPGEIRAPPVRFIAGGPEDPKQGMGRCVTCRTKIVDYQPATGLWIDVSGHSHTGDEIELIPEASSSGEPEPENSSNRESQTSRVTQRVTDVGYYYRVGDKELGPYRVEDEQGLKFDGELAGHAGRRTQRDHGSPP